MERRDFLKISATSGAIAALEGCGNPDHQLIRFIPEQDLVPGIATWKSSICTLCPAGCGMRVRVMQGEAEVVRRGQLGILKMGLAKKLEGNPAHPISQGKLCPRGQAGLQVTYHPDRVRNPLVRSGSRGSGQFREITWGEAIKQLVAQLTSLQDNKQESGLAFVTSKLRGQRGEIVRRFTGAFKGMAPVEFEFFDRGVAEQANSYSFGQAVLPTVDLGQSNYVISFGADFLGTWNSPVAQSVGYGRMRQGRSGQRGKFVQFEPRISQTGANADEWVASRPGTEGILALSIANVILREKLHPAAATSHVGTSITSSPESFSDYAPEAIEARVGVPAGTIARIAREAAANTPAIALIGDGPTAHTNGSFNALAVNALNSILGSVGKPGGILFTPAWMPQAAKATVSSKENARTSVRNLADQIHAAPDAVKVMLLYNANPVFATPAAWRVRDAFEKVPFIASFGSFIDETSALADLILPDHSPLESWLDDAPPSGSARIVASVAPPAMHPLHDTRSMPDVLLDVAQQLGGPMHVALPWKTYNDALKAAFSTLQKQRGSVTESDPNEFWKKVQAEGGWWSTDDVKQVSPTAVKMPVAALKNSAPQFEGSPDEFPLHFLPFASQLYYDGSLAHLPWMQETPDPLSTVMWGTWIEINPQTAGKMAIQQGDLVEVTSQHGKLRAPALLTQGIAPDVVAMPVGQGHENFTRYATGRGANPISILAPMTDSETGSLAWAATRVKISGVGRGKLVQYGGSISEASPELKHR